MRGNFDIALDYIMCLVILLSWSTHLHSRSAARGRKTFLWLTMCSNGTTSSSDSTTPSSLFTIASALFGMVL